MHIDRFMRSRIPASTANMFTGVGAPPGGTLRDMLHGSDSKEADSCLTLSRGPKPPVYVSDSRGFKSLSLWERV